MVRTVLVDASKKVQEAHTDQIASGSVEVLDSPPRERLADLGRLCVKSGLSSRGRLLCLFAPI